jgi:cellulose synthase/poly-beta-1,6-N-acetylglucosamine synthase-like glycosyltransferase
MVTFNTVIFALFILTWIFIFTSILIDYRKKRDPTRYPFASFLVPAFNAERYVKKTIESIRKSYGGEYEIIVVNDCSKDNTLKILRSIRDKDMKIISNRENSGRAHSLNNAFMKSRGEIIFVVDSDSIINKRAVDDLVARLENKKVAAASCRGRPIEKGFLAKMQALEYGMSSTIFTACNPFSTISLWGCCFAVRRAVFEQVGMMKKDSIGEDVDLALRIGEKGWIVQEGSFSVLTSAPTTIKSWYKQKIRWGSATFQNYINHPAFIFTHPLFIIFTIVYTLLAIAFSISTIHNVSFIQNVYLLYSLLRDAGYSFLITWGFVRFAYGAKLLEMIAVYVLYPWFSLPYVFINEPQWKKRPVLLLLVIPFVMVYFIVYAVVSLIGFAIGIYRFFTIKKGRRAW